MKSTAPILVTGSHSSGTTWVGRTIASARRMAYLHEPFNTFFDRDICKAKFPSWFTYVCDENEHEYINPIQDMLDFHPRFLQGLAISRTSKQVAKQVRTLAQFSMFRLFHFRPLVKDPIAIFSVEWLVKRFNMTPIILIRHPAAFAGSLKRNNWDHPFEDFQAQPLLMRDYLAPFSTEIALFAREKQDVIDQAALLWKMLYYVVSIYQRKYPNWIFIRHEDLSLDPLSGFKGIFQKTMIPFNSQTEQAIRMYTGGVSKTQKKNK